MGFNFQLDKVQSDYAGLTAARPKYWNEMTGNVKIVVDGATKIVAEYSSAADGAILRAKPDVTEIT